MNLISKRIRGMQDLLPPSSAIWEAVEEVFKSEASVYGFNLIRTPVLENTELFERSAGDESDVVQKEMYTFDDKGGRSVSLRPEGTAGVVRAVLENGLHNGTLPLKLMYITSCYRYEKPQAGRLREFFQFGAEIFGTESALADAELIMLGNSIFSRLKLQGISLQINSIGCPECRKKYTDAIKKYFEIHKSDLCETCRERLYKNPMRIFDCKSPECQQICKDAPIILDYICADCKEHFENLKKYLSDAKIPFSVNPSIVRGLDYYSRTVFEFVYSDGETPITVCGGGRYDGLAQDLSGTSLPALGFGIGIERILMVMEKQKLNPAKNNFPALFIACADSTARSFSLELAQKLRQNSINTLVDISEKRVKHQMKYADKIGAHYVLVVGSDEFENRKAQIKDMRSGESKDISLDENFVSNFINIVLQSS
ncbi:MAG: histidine--tRNA ligase [Clostridia bacterium]|nr:histidine--tRNA ligase [Clostridia bacterium]